MSATPFERCRRRATQFASGMLFHRAFGEMLRHVILLETMESSLIRSQKTITPDLLRTRMECQELRNAILECGTTLEERFGISA